MGDLDDFRKKLDATAAMQGWIAATQNRNVRSILEGQGPGGERLAANTAYTIARKGHGQVGVRSSGMLEAMTDPRCVKQFVRTADGADASVGAAPPGSSAEYSELNAANAGKKVQFDTVPNLPAEMKVNLLVKGQPGRLITKRGVRHNKKKGDVEKVWNRKLGPQPPRDFVGVAEADVDAAGEVLLGDVAEQLGFREA